MNKPPGNRNVSGVTLSAHVTEALERDIRRRRLQQVLDDHEAQIRDVGEDELAEIHAAWQG